MERLSKFYIELDLKIFSTKVDKLVEDGIEFMERENLFWNFPDIYRALAQARKVLEPKQRWNNALQDSTNPDEILTRAVSLLEINELDEKLKTSEESDYVALREDDEFIIDEDYERNHNFVVEMIDRDMKRLHAVPVPDGNLAQ